MSDDKPPSTKTSWLGRLVNIFSPTPDNREQLSDILQKSHESQVIDRDALDIMEGALRVGETQAREIMIPRSQMEVIQATAKISEVLPQIIESGHSRFPVVGESAEDIVGILLAKDLLPLVLGDREDLDICSMVRPATIIPESKRLGVLLREFREQRYHMAMVVDEYGSVSGLLTIEDILEEIVGEIEDETDEEELPQIRRFDEEHWLVEAQTEIEDFNEEFETGLSEDDFDTVGGIITNTLGHLPQVGDQITIDNMHFEVIEANDRKIDLLKLHFDKED
jgi:magnesium and cobalt transporter